MLSAIVSTFALCFALAGALAPALVLAVGGAFSRWYAFAAPTLAAAPARAPALAAWANVLADIDAAPARPVVCAPQCPAVARLRRLAPQSTRGLDYAVRPAAAPAARPAAAPAAPPARDARGRFARRWQAACQRRP